MTLSLGKVWAVVPNWNGGWVNAFYVDPTIADSQNPHVKPPSPNGGLAISTWDNSGGGNTVAMVTEPVADVLVEAYVHIEGPMTPFNPTPYSPSVPTSIPDTYNVADGEWWAMGVRGTASANGNPPDVGGYFASVAPGIGTRYHFVTGICWAHFRTPTFSQLWLLDMGNGAQPGNPNNYTVLAGPIDIPTSGWHRVRILAQGNEVMANFGGTVGCNDGQVFFGTTTTTNSGGVYLAYREAILYNQNGSAGWHPPVYDDLRVQVPVQTKTFLGMSHEAIMPEKKDAYIAGLTDEGARVSATEAFATADKQAGRDILKYAARFPTVLIFAFGLIALYFRSRGGYKPIELEASAEAEA